MAVGAEIPQPEPAPIVTIAVRTKVLGSVDRTGTPVGRGHRIGWHWRRCFGRRGVLFTQDAMGLVGEAEEQRTMVEHLLRERILLRGIYRAAGVSFTWLLH